MRIWFRQLKIKHWVKNTLIFLPYLLNGDFQFNEFYPLLLAFIAFSFLASSVYLYNDLRDIHDDRLHPIKRNRPLASGRIKTNAAKMVFAFLIVAAFILGYSFFSGAINLFLAYLLANVVYTERAKKVKYYDIIFLVFFYIIRLYIGAAIGEVDLTNWFMITLTLLFAALGINKRVLELKLRNEKDGTNQRGYTFSDLTVLEPLVFNLLFSALVMINLHANIELGIQQTWFYIALNVLVLLMILSYFDSSPREKIDDPIEKVMKTPQLILCTALLVVLYVSVLT